VRGGRAHILPRSFTLEAALLARIRSAAVLGVDALGVDVEVDIANGLPSFTTVGLQLGAVKEGRERVAAALGNAGLQLPLRRITVNLAPADLPKEGSHYDLPIALGLLESPRLAIPSVVYGLFMFATGATMIAVFGRKAKAA
jgi:magnesium chelatase family protein